MLEKVQRTTTKLVSGIAGLHEHDRLAKLNLLSLSCRRAGGDLITVLRLLSDKFAPDIPSLHLFLKREA